jgi:hypothetical protein
LIDPALFQAVRSKTLAALPSQARRQGKTDELAKTEKADKPIAPGTTAPPDKPDKKRAA